MKILLNNNDLNEALYNVSNLGFVPTMGSLHKGHVSLIKKSLKECKKTIVSIFINPTQFNNKNDYKNYPRNTKKDLTILKKLNIDFVYLPKVKDVYSFKRKSSIKLQKKDKILCAKFRKGHFEGVIDVMERLTDIVRPQKIYLGEKDYQQLYLLKKYITKNYNAKIISCPTIRVNNKLAFSSRNKLLSKNEFIQANKISKEIFLLKKRLSKSRNIKKLISDKKKELINSFNIKLDYLELRNKFNLKVSNKAKYSKLFVAFYINKVRLIDNF
jgi:pantoate--beta-alanine ligase